MSRLLSLLTLLSLSACIPADVYYPMSAPIAYSLGQCFYVQSKQSLSEPFIDIVLAIGEQENIAIVGTFFREQEMSQIKSEVSKERLLGVIFTVTAVTLKDRWVAENKKVVACPNTVGKLELLGKKPVNEIKRAREKYPNARWLE